jgi:hypothetical protein
MQYTVHVFTYSSDWPYISMLRYEIMLSRNERKKVVIKERENDQYGKKNNKRI